MKPNRLSTTALLVMAAVALNGCSDDGETSSPLPTVEASVLAGESPSICSGPGCYLRTCLSYETGADPITVSRFIQNEERCRLGICNVDGECRYDCPPQLLVLCGR